MTTGEANIQTLVRRYSFVFGLCIAAGGLFSGGITSESLLYSSIAGAIWSAWLRWGPERGNFWVTSVLGIGTVAAERWLFHGSDRLLVVVGGFALGQVIYFFFRRWQDTL
jgi:hypothetical protein